MKESSSNQPPLAASPTISRAPKKSRSIQSRLVFWFLLLSLLPLLLLTLAVYQSSMSRLKEMAHEQLAQAANTKAKFISGWFSERFMDINVQAKKPGNIQLIKQLSGHWQDSSQNLPLYVKSHDWTQLVRPPQNELNSLTQQYDYIYDILLVDKAGNILFTIAKESDLGTNLVNGPYAATQFAVTVRQTLQQKKTLFSGLEHYLPSDNKLSGFITAPLIESSGELVGAFVIQLNLDRFFSIVVDPLDNSSHLNNYLIDKNGFLQTPISNNWNEVLALKIDTEQYKRWKNNHTIESEKITDRFSNNQSAAIQEIAFEYTGPLNSRVIGMHQTVQLGNTDWILITEIDRDQAFSAASQLTINSIFISSITMLFVLIASVFISRRITKPIILLEKNILNISSNQSSQVIHLETNDEISRLAESFSKMLSVKFSQEAVIKENQKIAETNLLKIEQQNYALDQHAIVAITDTKGTITLANQNFSDISGYSIDELVGNNHRILNSNYHDKYFFEKMYHCIAKGNVWKGEICNKSKQGSIYWVDTTIIPFKDDKGKPKSYVAIRADITQRKKTELELAKSEAMNRSIFNSVADGIITISHQGRIIASNPAADQMFGYDDDELSNQKLTILVPKESKEIHLLGFKQIQKDQQHHFLSKTVQVDGLRKNGETFPIDLTISQVTIGELSYFATTVRDISKRHQLEKQRKLVLKTTHVKLKIAKILSKHSQLSSRMVAALKILFSLEWLSSADKGAIFLANEKNNSFSISCHIGDFDNTLSRDLVQCEMVSQSREISIINQLSLSAKNTLLLKQQNLTESTSINRNEPEQSSCVYYVPISNSSLSFNPILGVMTLYCEHYSDSFSANLTLLQEISDLFASAIIQENARKMFEQASVIAEQNSQLKSDFLASMSHEIRTPMNGVIGMLELLLSSQLSKDQYHKANLAKSSAQSLLTLINDILDFSKIEAGKMNLEVIDFDLHKTVSDLIETMTIKVCSNDLKIKPELTEIQNSLVQGDPGRIKQILTNLIGNAIKFTQQGEITIRASLTRTVDDRLRLDCSVSDTGIGIAEDKIANLFEKFTQADVSTTRKYGGTGLGLSICKKLCALMEGHIHVTSELGQGSQFSFSVILQKSELSIEQSTNIDLGNQQSKLNQLANHRLMLVEDNDINQQVALGMLEQLGLTASVATNGVEALQLLRKSPRNEPYDLVLMDCQMPQMDGYEASQQIRQGGAGKRYRCIKIIAMTANAMQGDRERCLQAGMDDYIAKPIETGILLKKLHQWLMNSKTLERLETTEQQKTTDKTFSLTKNAGEEPQKKSAPILNKVWDRTTTLKRLHGNKRLLLTLIELFIKDMPKKIQALQMSAEKNNCKEVRHYAHTVKGVAANLDGTELIQQAAQLELAALQENTAEFPNKLAKLIKAFDEFLSHLKDYSKNCQQQKQKEASTKMSDGRLKEKQGSTNDPS